MAIRKVTLPSFFWFITATVLLYAIQLLILCLPLKWYIRIFYNRKGGKYRDSDDERLSVVMVALERGVKYLPWTGKCMVQAMTGKVLLKMNGLNGTIYLGVRKENEKIKAHAWLISGGVFISGKKGYDRFTVVQEIT